MKPILKKSARRAEEPPIPNPQKLGLKQLTEVADATKQLSSNTESTETRIETKADWCSPVIYSASNTESTETRIETKTYRDLLLKKSTSNTESTETRIETFLLYKCRVNFVSSNTESTETRIETWIADKGIEEAENLQYRIHRN